MNNLLKEYSELLANQIRKDTPVRTGNLLKSIKPSSTDSQISIDMLDYGVYVDNRTHFITNNVRDFNEIVDRLTVNFLNDINDLIL